MTENYKFEFKLNASPHLKMIEITKRMFNKNFHADVQFSVEGKIIFAHSLELIKRSVVFEQQLEETIGEKKLIPIMDCKYEIFLEFIRFIYTDECEINEDNGIEILKLAVKYKVIMLENRVLRFGKSTNWALQLYEFCVRDKYELAYNLFHKLSAVNFPVYAVTEELHSLHPDTIDAILKHERFPKGVTELQIFTALADWIASYCMLHRITFLEGRIRFDSLIKKIRFPTMSIDQIRECVNTYPALLSEFDYISIATQTVFEASDNENGLWISKCREEFIWPETPCTFKQAEQFCTMVSVSRDTVLQGFRIGIEDRRKPIQIEIVESDDISNEYQKCILVESVPDFWSDLIISLGDSIRLRPNFTYSISIKYLGITNKIFNNLKVVCRAENIDVIIKDPGETVNLIHASPNMLEMFFKPVID